MLAYQIGIDDVVRAVAVQGHLNDDLKSKLETKRKQVMRESTAPIIEQSIKGEPIKKGERLPGNYFDQFEGNP